jgi:hypothetical protein
VEEGKKEEINGRQGQFSDSKGLLLLRCKRCLSYWSLREDRPEQYNGWCDYLGKGDIEIAQEMEVRNAKTGEVCKACDLPFPMSLLWDQCKECGIQCDDEDDDEEVECADNPCC